MGEGGREVGRERGREVERGGEEERRERQKTPTKNCRYKVQKLIFEALLSRSQ